MSDLERPTPGESEATPAEPPSSSSSLSSPGPSALPRSSALYLWVALAVVALVAALVARGLLAGGTPTGSGPSPAGSAGSITSTRNDAVADYRKARASGLPVYVLFHSLS